MLAANSCISNHCHAESDVEWAYWFADQDITCLLLRLVIFLKPILHTLSTKCGDEDAVHVPFQIATQSVRVVNDAYNSILAAAGNPKVQKVVETR